MRPLLPLVCALPLLSQTLPLTNPAKPAVLKASLLNGGIRVVGHDRKEVVVEGVEADSDKYPGMRRIGGAVEERDNVVRIQLHPARAVKGTIVVKLPYGSSVELKTMAGGPLVVEDVRGPVEAEHMAGDIRIQGAVGTVAATTLSGSVTVDLARLEGPLNLATMSGGVRLSLPRDAKASFRAHVMSRSRFTCELPLQEQGRDEDHPGPTVVRGTLNGGGTQVTLRAVSGKVQLVKR